MALAFTLPDTAGSPVALHEDGARAAVVVFTCNHCPYALAWHERLQDVARDYADRACGSCRSTPTTRTSTRGTRSRLRVRGSRRASSPGPYLVDESQEVARAWGAKTTPDVFVTDATGVVYRGAPDADYDDPSLNASWLREALDDVLAGRPVARPETEPKGCSVKWK